MPRRGRRVMATAATRAGEAEGLWGTARQARSGESRHGGDGWMGNFGVLGRVWG